MKTICYIASGVGLITVLIAATLPHTDYTAAAAMIGAVTIYGGFVEAEWINHREIKRAVAARRKREQDARRMALKVLERRSYAKERMTTDANQTK